MVLYNYLERGCWSHVIYRPTEKHSSCIHNEQINVPKGTLTLEQECLETSFGEPKCKGNEPDNKLKEGCYGIVAEQVQCDC